MLTPLTIFLLLVYIAVLGGCMFAFFCADADSDGLKGELSRLLVKRIPFYLSRAVKTTLGDRLHGVIADAIDYTFNRRNPILQGTYLCIINGAFALWLVYGQPRLPTYLASRWHGHVALLLVLASQYSFFVVCTADPGTITAETHRCYDHFDFDNLLYEKGSVCRTCKLSKIPRSKHCSYCNRCIAKFDHHCVWINQCVGESNYRYFLLFLAVNSVFFWYGSYVLALVVMSEAVEKDYFNATFYNPRTRQHVKSTSFLVYKYIFEHNVVLCGLFLLAAVMAIALTLFLGYHFHLVAAGTTTNETFKWGDLGETYYRLIEGFEKESAKGEVKGFGKVYDKSAILRSAMKGESLCTGHPGEFPSNIYNNGIVSNFREVFLPESDKLFASVPPIRSVNDLNRTEHSVRRIKQKVKLG